jgi:hypothetical protein
MCVFELMRIRKNSLWFQAIFKEATEFKSHSADSNSYPAYILFVKINPSDCWFQPDAHNLTVHFRRKDIVKQVRTALLGKYNKLSLALFVLRLIEID